VSPFSLADLPDLTGRTVIVTGASSGIGRVTAAALAGAGARVVLAVRDIRRGESAASGIGGQTEVRELDLASLASVRQFAAGWGGPVDLLINNAGVMVPPHRFTADGFELQFGTNHLGHFALTNLLLRHVTGRVVTVSSVAHRAGEINFDDLNWQRRHYRRWAAYGQSKLANLLFTAELQRRLDEAGSSVIATAAHPGYTDTNLQFHSGLWSLNLFSRLSNRLFAQSAEDGALPILYAAVAEIPGNSYVGPSGRRETRGPPTLVGRSARASDPALARRLWEASEQLTGTSFPL
jgi:NAD(P)-dependent dehydrogenase (short-subunit alcohol dehydrogenase family)